MTIIRITEIRRTESEGTAVKKKTKIFFRKLAVAVCAAGTYIMAFMTSDFFRRDLPFDFVSGLGILLCNIIVLYFFVESGSDLRRDYDDYYEDELTAEVFSPDITAEGFSEDFYESYFGRKSG